MDYFVTNRLDNLLETFRIRMKDKKDKLSKAEEFDMYQAYKHEQSDRRRRARHDKKNRRTQARPRRVLWWWVGKLRKV